MLCLILHSTSATRMPMSRTVSLPGFLMFRVVLSSDAGTEWRKVCPTPVTSAQAPGSGVARSTIRLCSALSDAVRYASGTGRRRSEPAGSVPPDREEGQTSRSCSRRAGSFRLSRALSFMAVPAICGSVLMRSAAVPVVLVSVFVHARGLRPVGPHGPKRSGLRMLPSTAIALSSGLSPRCPAHPAACPAPQFLPGGSFMEISAPLVPKVVAHGGKNADGCQTARKSGAH